MSDAPERGTVPRWLAITGAVVAATAALVGIFVGLYPIFHHTSDHGVSAYHNLVSATCSRIHDIESGTSTLPQPVRYDEGVSDWVYDKAAVIANYNSGYSVVSSQLDTLKNHAPPKALGDKYHQMLFVYAEWTNEYKDWIGLLQSPSIPSPLSETQIRTALAPARDAVARVQAQLGDALSGLADKPCAV